MTRPVRKLWSDSAVKFLRTQAGRRTVASIARQLNRSEAAVRFKAWQLRLRLRVPA